MKTRFGLQPIMLFPVIVVGVFGVGITGWKWHQRGVEPIETLLPNFESSTPSSSVLLQFVSQRRDAATGDDWLRFVLLNPTSEIVYYLGYTLESFEPRLPAGTIHPCCLRRVQLNNQWHEQPAWWCGTGLESLPLPSGQAGVFEVRKQTGDHGLQIGVFCSTENAEEFQVENLVWSPVVAEP